MISKTNTRYINVLRERFLQIIALLLLLGILGIALLNGCGSPSALQNQAEASYLKLETAITTARSAGVSEQQLAPVLLRKQLIIEQAPMTLFQTQVYHEYYHRSIEEYAQLQTEVQRILQQATIQAQRQALQDLQALQRSLEGAQQRGFPVNGLQEKLKRTQQQSLHAQLPREFAAISAEAQRTNKVLTLLPENRRLFQEVQGALSIMQKAHLNTEAIQKQYKSGQQLFARQDSPESILQVHRLLTTTLKQAKEQALQALPSLTTSSLQALETDINAFQHYGGDPEQYTRWLREDWKAVPTISTYEEYSSFAQKVQAHQQIVHQALLRQEGDYRLQQLSQDITTWASMHPWYNGYDGGLYDLNAGYMEQGVFSDLRHALADAQTDAELARALQDIKNAQFNHQLLKENYRDRTPFDQPHNTDKQALLYYGVEQKLVIVVSFTEQALRVYQQGRLLRAFYVATGRPELPSLPGFWPVLQRLSPTKFTSPYPPGSPYWYPDTPINYAIMYHQGGYFIHDTAWRGTYGPGSQFPHQDASRNQTSAGTGSHGCINLPVEDMQWLYQHTNQDTAIIIY
ncbi:L,D-transpeptidase-like protein [Thermosporothrix hazakensis]|jgi:lipoprotein-anchoring transpeptidase ErfK/SrfK|uniref:L,D-transpeptidase-like protein n=1 Tax=Thermosporothrix hazakensis TaxID=644383 RepID=A0A326U4A4_THEHA|nr:L,D-transpeptidase [Thermosporothrix hazakensis]PZW25721.1 L,D-transpeptidase-like protein [Thermosporothrix hazakensis]GCE48218.1 hypothetical protein KTH_30870 [Thermosporothrix hazakensis]